ncbi:MAG: hypothetical protein KDJ52_29335 [Anaerolineae bacterium]|nr:hypothetical protein [Anaerolineae bacterium]
MTTFLIVSLLLNVALILINRLRRVEVESLEDENRRAWKYNRELQLRLERITRREMVVSDLMIMTRDARPSQQITIYRN